MRSDAPVLAPTFRSQTQGDLLARILLQPEQEWTLTELSVVLGMPLTTVQSEVKRLANGGILVTRKVGRARLVRANLESPSVIPLTHLVLVTFGPQVVVGQEFAALRAERIIIFGSWAERYHGVKGAIPADIDVLVVSDEVERSDLYAAAEKAEARLGMAVNPVLRNPQAWNSYRDDPLLVDINSGHVVEVTHLQA
jgi:hypothetical protein